MKGGLRWRFLPFDQLDTPTLYRVLQLRAEVFVVEQQCAFQDLDGSDAQAWHLLGRDEAGQLLAYARCFDAGLKYAEASIGRVVTAPGARGGGLGHGLMREALAHMAALWGPQPVRIGAQAQLQGFYEQHGFVVASEPYMEDGIAHIEMRRNQGDSPC